MIGSIHSHELQRKPMNNVIVQQYENLSLAILVKFHHFEGILTVALENDSSLAIG